MHCPLATVFVSILTLSSLAPAQALKVVPPSKTHPEFQAAAAQVPAPLPPTSTGSSFLVGGTDDCVAADPITGVGTFAVNTTGATTNTQQSGACPNANNDVWFSWTAPSSGVASLQTCGGVTVDSVVAAYDGAGCPTGTNLLACNDDFCGLQSGTTFPCIAGNVYTLQLGSFGSSGPYSGTFTLNVSVPSGNDACAAPEVITGLGPHNFDNSFASTGAEGQAEALCLFFGSTAINNDLWFAWTAPSTATFSLNTCGQTAVDTKIAVYNGAGCPTSAAIACNDDVCGLQTNICFNATFGQTYTLQVGTFPGAQGGIGTFTFAPVTAAGPCQPFDDGTSDNSVGLTAGGGLAWFNGFGASSGNTTVTTVHATFGTPVFPGGTPPAGTTFQVAIWDDPNDDGNLTDGVLQAGSVTNATIEAGSIDNDVFQSINIPPTTVNGTFFVGVVLTHAAGQFPAPLDQSAGGSLCGGGAGGSWVAGDTTGTFNLVDLNANNVPPITIASAGLPGNWLLRIDCAPTGPGTGYCFGDGSGIPCPCGNTGIVGHGCGNSVNAGGALLTASGNAQVSNDTLVLLGSGMPNQNCLYFQGTAQVTGIFGDGLRCVRGTVTRIGMKTNVGGASQYPSGPSDPSLSVVGTVPAAGATINYQVWYLNSESFCTPAAFNFSNGLQVVWAP
jgi:hypothetical protein